MPWLSVAPTFKPPNMTTPNTTNAAGNAPAFTPAKTIHLVCRHEETGREIAHQGFASDDAARAERCMIARNRAEINAGSGYRWGIETEIATGQP